MTTEDWNRFGWEGIRFLKPAEWELSHVEGNFRKGYVVLDDGIRCRLQLRWQQTDKLGDLKRTAKRQTEILRKKAGCSINASDIGDARMGCFEGKKLRFASDGAETIYHMLQCRECMRVVLIGVFGSKNENVSRLSGRIVRSLRDHSANDRTWWSAFGFSFSVPQDLVLRKHNLHSGDLTFEFASANGQFNFHKFSVANMHLKNRSLSDWFLEFADKRYAGATMQIRSDLSGRHAHTVRAVGKPRRGFHFFNRKAFQACFWHCEDMNSILGVTEIADKSGSRLEEMAQGVVCHEKSDEAVAGTVA